MRINKFITLLISVTLLLACNTKSNKTEETSLNLNKISPEIIQPSKAKIILDLAIDAHGGNLYNSANYSFIFRNNTYHFKNDGENFEYLKISKKDGFLTKDLLKNDVFSRSINGKTVELSEKEISNGSQNINSVIYFATLPHKLNDKAVNKTYIGETTIKGEKYDILAVTFNKDGGGKDFEDEFYYWINKDTHKIDYLAYNYMVNNGGVRFRSAYNTRIIDGITFQDYINYRAEIGTPLKELPKLYETKKLKELSKIKTETIINLNNK